LSEKNILIHSLCSLAIDNVSDSICDCKNVYCFLVFFLNLSTTGERTDEPKHGGDIHPPLPKKSIFEENEDIHHAVS